MKMLNMLSRSGRRERLRGAAIVEFAVVAPVLIAILMGIIEYGYVFLVQQTLTNAAREGARIAVLQSTTSDDPINARIAEIMAAAGIDGYTVTLTHADPAGDPTERVEISVPYNSVSLTGFFGSRDYDLKGRCAMRKEGI